MGAVKLLLVSLSLLMITCNPEVGGGSVNEAIELQIKAKDGKDMLDPANPTGYKKDSIRVYYVVNGKNTEVYRPNYDAPRSFLIDKGYVNYIMTLYPNDLDYQHIVSTTLIKWTYNEIDTIDCEIEIDKSSITNTKVWYNHKLRYSFYDLNNPQRLIEIIK